MSVQASVPARCLLKSLGAWDVGMRSRYSRWRRNGKRQRTVVCGLAGRASRTRDAGSAEISVRASTALRDGLVAKIRLASA
jgi:hypothetical protein